MEKINILGEGGGYMIPGGLAEYAASLIDVGFRQRGSASVILAEVGEGAGEGVELPDSERIGWHRSRNGCRNGSRSGLLIVPARHCC